MLGLVGKRRSGGNSRSVGTSKYRARNVPGRPPHPSLACVCVDVLGHSATTYVRTPSGARVTPPLRPGSRPTRAHDSLSHAARSFCRIMSHVVVTRARASIRVCGLCLACRVPARRSTRSICPSASALRCCASSRTSAATAGPCAAISGGDVGPVGSGLEPTVDASSGRTRARCPSQRGRGYSRNRKRTARTWL
jgi:hypothetical protein